jgi:ABC-type enterochelin transport system permease subunit
LFSFPLVFDAIAVRLILYPYSKSVAFVTGLLCGAIVLLFILDTFKNSFSPQYKKEYELQ